MRNGHCGTVKNARMENAGRKYRGRKFETGKMRDQNALNCIRCRDGAADAADPVVVSLSGCYGDDEAILMWKLRKGDVSQ